MRPQTAYEWVKRIETTGKEMCNDIEGQRIQFKKKAYNQYDFEFKGKEVLECGINAINSYIDHMPIIQQMYYKKLLLKLEHEKRRYI